MRALVTGAAKRLGRSMALELAALGYDVVVHYASSNVAAEETVSEIKEMGRAAVALQADLLNEAEASDLMRQAAEALGGPITLLVNNASLFEPDTIEDATRDSWDRHMGSNLRAPFVLIQALQAQDSLRFHESGDPAIVVNIVDQRVKKLTPDFMSYTLAKSALWTLTQTAAQALAPRVRVNAIAPGPTLQGARQTASDFARQCAATPLKQGASPEAITDALRYLVLAKSVTGQMMFVDGGQHLAWETPDVLVPE